MQHLDEGTIHAWLDGALPTAEAREVEQHVAICSECAAVVAEARGLIAGASRIASSLDVVRGNVIPKKPASGAGKSLWHSLHLTPARAALAATVMIAVSTLLTVRHDTENKLVPPTAQSSVTAAPASGGAAANNAKSLAPASAPAQPPTVASSSPAKEAAAPRPKDRLESLSKPKSEARADVATDANERVRDSRPADAPKTTVAAAPPVVSAPTSAAGVAAATSLDTSAKKLAKTAEMDTALFGEARVQQTFSRSLASMSDAASSNLACFQFAESPPRGVPQRFALVQDTSQRIVRAVSENGRLDTVIKGSTWTRVTPTEVSVRFASNDRPVTVPFRDPTFNSLARTRQEAARRAGPSVSRLPCQP